MNYHALFVTLAFFIALVQSYKRLSDTDLKKIPTLRDPTRLDPHNGDLLPKILIPRISDTEGNRKVRKFIKDHFEKLNWHVEEHTFDADLPDRFGKNRSMTNLIMTHNPKAPRKLVLSAHYDSKLIFKDDGYSKVDIDKLLEQNVFVGATDSAAPVAILMDIAEALDKVLDDSLNRSDNNCKDVTLQMIFFDGEEAFGEWSDQDSIYGSKALAELWENSEDGFRRDLPHHRTSKRIDSIEYLILLDLLGSKGSTIHDIFDASSWLFNKMVEIQNRMSQLNILEKDINDINMGSFFVQRINGKSQLHSSAIADDHVPFLIRGVKVLHAIAYPFPSVWHTIEDNVNALDMNTIINWSLIFRAMILEYFEISLEWRKDELM